MKCSDHEGSSPTSPGALYACVYATKPHASTPLRRSSISAYAKEHLEETSTGIYGKDFTVLIPYPAIEALTDALSILINVMFLMIPC